MLGRFEFPADLETPVSAFLKVTPLTPVFLLESVEKNETVGRYSFIGILPKKYLILQQPEQLDSFFNELEDTLAQIGTNAPINRLPSGLVGYVSYDAASLLHPKLKQKLSGDPLAAFVLPSTILVFDHLKRRLQLSSILPENEQEKVANEVRSCLGTSPLLPHTGRSSEPVANVTRGDFGSMVNEARNAISAGDVYQIVLSMQFEGESKAHPFQMYRALRMINPSPYMFYFNFQNRFQFFGSSPETMVRTEKRVDGKADRIILRPIAGTRPRGNSQEEDERLEKELLSDEKEKAEHLMLLDLARNDLGRLADVGSVKVTEFMKVERYSHVMHLVSTVESTVSAMPSLRNLFAAVFPAGTVSGAPKIRAMQLIHDLEPHTRGLYAGSLGYFGSGGEVDHCIAIRSLRYSDERYLFTAGAGIVADSSAENEYQEIANKAMALKTMLRLVEDPL